MKDINSQKYNVFGKLESFKPDNIRKGDLVEYIKTECEYNLIEKKIVKIKIPLLGIWNGEFVQFADNEKTIVRTINWLKLISKCPLCGK